MENFIKYVHINNFKSIADLTLEDCKRINLFIGCPNVGKSNALEALSLFSLPYLNEGENINRLIRAENKNGLFFDNSINACSVRSNNNSVELNTDSFIIRNQSTGTEKQFFLSTELSTDTDIDNREGYWETSVKRYMFHANQHWFSNNAISLSQPFGENMMDVLLNNPDISEVNAWIKRELAKIGFEYLLDTTHNTIKIQRQLSDNKVKQLPYSSLSETLQRIIFYKTVIASNKNSILLFKEPEAQIFPPYIQTIMQDIIDAKSSQFFIATYSPLAVNAFLEYEKLRKETSIYLFGYQDNQTTAKRLSNEEIELAYEYSDDLFFNLENLL